MTDKPIGPILILDDIRDGTIALAALFIGPADTAPSAIQSGSSNHQATPILIQGSRAVWRIRFTLPMASDAHYLWENHRFDVACDYQGDLRLAYVSCNGEEHGDLDRDGSERNAMWAHLGRAQKQSSFHLLLHGGDQVYADEATHGHPLSEDWPDSVPRTPSQSDLEDLKTHLAQHFFDRYTKLYAAPEFAWIAARVPSLMQWDDHDICDGWGSLPRKRTHSDVGQALFQTARRMALAFQHGTQDRDLPARFGDPGGVHLGWQIDAPGLRLLAPDLRSERTRRQVMGPGGWQMIERAGQQAFEGRTLLLSSVPLLGPRLSVLETLMVLIPRMQKYEDDLRDQWQSRAHRHEWRRILRHVLRLAAPQEAQITALSGEIHLATRATMALDQGKVLHQLVASGISHRAPPKAWARILGTLAWTGEAPLDNHPIRILPLPGQKRRYAAERNYLVLERTNSQWHAFWELEETGRTAQLPL